MIICEKVSTQIDGRKSINYTVNIVCIDCGGNAPIPTISRGRVYYNKLCKLCKKKRLSNYYFKNKKFILPKKEPPYITREERSKRNREANLKYYKKNKLIIAKKQKKYWKENKDIIKEKAKISRVINKNKHREYRKKWNIINKEYILAYQRKRNRIRYNTDILYKIKTNLKGRIRNALKDIAKSDCTIKLLGCSIENLKKHLESKFQIGMAWDNYSYEGWHVDHIIPCDAFDLTKSEEQRKCFNWKNL